MVLITSMSTIVLLSVVFIFLGAKNKVTSVDDYITHRGKSSLAVTSYSLAASGLGAWILFSPGETASWAGITGLIGYALGSAIPFFLLVFFGPKLVHFMPKGYGLGNYVYVRFGPKTSLFISIVMLFYMGTFLTAELTAIGQVLSFSFGIPLIVSCAGIMILVFAYVFRGGLGASINTDKIQFYVMIPLLVSLAVAVTASISQNGSIIKQINNVSPNLLSLSYMPGWKFGLVLIIGITTSELFNQVLWQRVYSIEQKKSSQKAFLLGGFIVMPSIILAGFFGIFAQASGTFNSDEPSLAVFSLLPMLSPFFMVVLVVLAFVLVTSSIDSLLNGIVSIIMSWNGKVGNDGDKDTAWSLKKAQLLTIVIGVVVVFFGSRGGSVLYLFLLADLVCASFAFPLVFGLFNKVITGYQVVIAGIVGLLFGAPFFPRKDFSSWSGLPADMFISFSLALVISTVLILFLAGVSSLIQKYADENKK